MPVIKVALLKIIIDYASLAFLEESFLCDNENLLSMDWIYFRNEIFFEDVFC